MTEHIQRIKTEVEATNANYYDDQHVTQDGLDNHDVVLAPPETPDPDVGGPLACVSYNTSEDEYAVFTGERTSMGYDVSTLESTHETVSKAVETAVGWLEAADAEDAEDATGLTTDILSEATIKSAIERHDDPDHPDVTTVEQIRDLFETLQQGVEEGWSEYMDALEDGAVELVAETGDLVVFSTGEHVMYEEELEHVYDGEIDDVTMDVFGAVMHDLAREHTDYDWGYTYPLVACKPDGFDAGQRYVEAVVNGLLARGLSPAEAWYYYGVKIRGNSNSSWGARTGKDRSTVATGIKRAERKLP